MMLRHAVSARSGPAPEGRLDNLRRVVGWVRDQDPSRNSAECALPGGGGIDPEVLPACDGFRGDWTEALAGVQVPAP